MKRFLIAREGGWQITKKNVKIEKSGDAKKIFNLNRSVTLMSTNAKRNKLNGYATSFFSSKIDIYTYIYILFFYFYSTMYSLEIQLIYMDEDKELRVIKTDPKSIHCLRYKILH